MRSLIVLLAVGVLSLGGCTPPDGSGAPVSEASAIKSAQTSVDDLGRAEQPSVVGLQVTRSYKTSSARSVTDSAGDVLTIDPAPSTAWVIEFSAPPQGIWQVVTALAVVDASTGVVRGSGLWKTPAGRPTK